MSVQTSFVPSYAYRGSGRHILPYLTDRELDGILDAVCDGRLIAVAQSDAPNGSVQGQRGIVALATPELVESIAHRDDSTVPQLNDELAKARRELDSLSQIVREVLAEKVPVVDFFDYRVFDAIEDVSNALNSAIDCAEDL